MERVRRAVLMPFALAWLACEWVWNTAIPFQVRVVERVLRTALLWPIERIVDLVEFAVRAVARLVRPLRPVVRRVEAVVARVDDAVRPLCVAIYRRCMNALHRISAPIRWISRHVNQRIIVPVAPRVRAAWRFVRWRSALVTIHLRLLGARFLTAARSLRSPR